MTAMDLRPGEGAEKEDGEEKEEGAQWIDTSDPVPEAIVPGTPGAPKELGPVVAEDFCAEKPMQFFARRKAFSWGEADWTFSDNAGNLEFEVTGGKFGYVRVKRFLTDAYGNQVLQMQNKPWTLKSKWMAYATGSEQPLWTMYKTGVLKLFRPSIDVFLGSNADRKVPDYHIQGNLFGRRGSISHGTETVAEVEQVMYAEGDEEDDTFVITVCQGVDYAFILSLLVITDMVYISSSSSKKKSSPLVSDSPQLYSMN